MAVFSDEEHAAKPALAMNINPTKTYLPINEQWHVWLLLFIFIGKNTVGIIDMVFF
jgi:hypothetical protein